MHEKRWPFVATVLGFLGLGAAVVVLALDLRSSREDIRRLQGRLAGLEETKAMTPGPPPPGRIGNSDVSVEPPRMDEDLSTRVAEIEKHLAVAKGREGLPEPLGGGNPEERKVPAEVASAPPNDSGLPSDRESLKKMLRDLQKEVQEEDSKREREDWQKGVFEGISKALELGPQQKDLVTQALQNRFREVEKLNDLSEAGKMTDDDWEKQVFAVRKAADDQIRSLLTADQVQRFDEWKKRQRWYGLREGNGNG